MTAHDPEFTLTGDDLLAWRRLERRHRELGRSARTTENTAAAIVQLAEYRIARRGARGGNVLLEAARDDVSGYLLALAGTGRSAATIHNRHAALRAAYRFLAEEDMIGASPVEQVRAPAPAYRVPAVVPDDQLAALLGGCTARKSDPAAARFAALRDAAMLRVLCEPGSPRSSELAGMAVGDVDQAAATITIRCGKYSRARVIPMSAKTARAVDRYLWARARHPKAARTTALWISATAADCKVTRSGVGQMLERRCALAGVPRMYPHQLRHTAFSDWDAASGNVNDAMALFGWASPAMVYHYGKDARGRRAVAAARALDRGSRI